MTYPTLQTPRSAGRVVGWALALGLLLGPFLYAQEPLPTGNEIDHRVMQEVKARNEIMANLTHLSDTIGHRLTGSASLDRACRWAAEKMKEYGLENVRLEGWELPVAWERGTAWARIVEPENGRTLTLAAMGWTPGTAGKLEGEVVVVAASNPEELKEYQGKLKGKIVLRGPPTRVRPIAELAAQAPGRPGPEATAPAATATAPASTMPAGPAGTRPEGFDSRPGRAGGLAFRREMNEFFRKEGVAVVLMDAGKPHGLFSMTGGWRTEDDRVSALDTVPAAFVIHEHYSLLHRLAMRPSGPKPRVAIEISNKLTPGPHVVHNVVGEIRGGEKPDEFVVVGAHIDSWDLGQGTTDNGTGTSVVLEAARALAKSGVKPRRTIRFVLFSGEEQGLHGSKAYVKSHKDEMDRTSAAIVHDTGTGKVMTLALQGREKLKPLLEREFAGLKALGLNELSTRNMGGSDHQSFDSAGVPGFMFQQDPAEYRLTHHSQSDTLDKARPDDLVQGAQVMAVMALRIANLDTLLPREKK